MWGSLFYDFLQIKDQEMIVCFLLLWNIPVRRLGQKALSAAKGSTTELKTITSDFHMTLGISTYMRNKQCGLPGLSAMSIIIILRHMKTAKTLLA